MSCELVFPATLYAPIAPGRGLDGNNRVASGPPRIHEDCGREATAHVDLLDQRLVDLSNAVTRKSRFAKVAMAWSAIHTQKRIDILDHKLERNRLSFSSSHLRSSSRDSTCTSSNSAPSSGASHCSLLPIQTAHIGSTFSTTSHIRHSGQAADGLHVSTRQSSSILFSHLREAPQSDKSVCVAQHHDHHAIRNGEGHVARLTGDNTGAATDLLYPRRR